jgi:hypothetical protein
VTIAIMAITDEELDELLKDHEKRERFIGEKRITQAIAEATVSSRPSF